MKIASIADVIVHRSSSTGARLRHRVLTSLTPCIYRTISISAAVATGLLIAFTLPGFLAGMTHALFGSMCVGA